MCLYCICTYDMYTCCKCGCREEDGISRNIKNPGFNIRPRLFLWDLQIQQFPVLLVGMIWGLFPLFSETSIHMYFFFGLRVGTSFFFSKKHHVGWEDSEVRFAGNFRLLHLYGHSKWLWRGAKMEKWGWHDGFCREVSKQNAGCGIL